MMLMTNHEVSVNQIAKEIRKRGAIADKTEVTVDLANLVIPEQAETDSLFLSIDLDKCKLDLCLIHSDCEEPLYPPISYDKTELELLIAFAYYLLDEIAA